MPRPDKVQAVQAIKESLEGSPVVFLTEYRGLSVADQQTLRRSLGSVQTRYQVVKMSLARRAAQEMGLEDLIGLLSGPTALAFTAGDPVAAAKALQDFAKDHGELAVKGALFRGELLPAEKVSELAEVEPREVLLAKFVGAGRAPMAQLAGLMSSFTRNAVTMFSQLLERMGEDPHPGPPPEGEGAESPEGEGADEKEE